MKFDEIKNNQILTKAVSKPVIQEEDPILTRLRKLRCSYYNPQNFLTFLYGNPKGRKGLLNLDTFDYLFLSNINTGEVGFGKISDFEHAKFLARRTFDELVPYTYHEIPTNIIKVNYERDNLIKRLENMPCEGWISASLFEEILKFEVNVESPIKRNISVSMLKKVENINYMDKMSLLAKIAKDASFEYTSSKSLAEDFYKFLYSDEVSIESFYDVYRVLSDNEFTKDRINHYDTIKDAKADYVMWLTYSYVTIGINEKKVILVKSYEKITEGLCMDIIRSYLDFSNSLDVHEGRFGSWLENSIRAVDIPQMIEIFEERNNIKIIAVDDKPLIENPYSDKEKTSLFKVTVYSDTAPTYIRSVLEKTLNSMGCDCHIEKK